MPIHPDTIREAISRSAISKVDLARQAGVHPNTLASVESDGWNPRWNTLSRLCTAADEIKRARA